VLLTNEHLSIMGMIVGRLFMVRVIVIVGPVVFGMIVLVITYLPLMAVVMAVLVGVRVSMVMFVRMAVFFVFVLVRMFMLMGVPMFVLMFMFVIAFHFKSSFLHVVLSIHLVSSTHPSPFYRYNWFGVFSGDDDRELPYHAQGGHDRDNDWEYDRVFVYHLDDGE